MQENIILLLTIAFMATSTSQGYVPRVMPKHQFDPSEIRALLASFASTNGSSLKEIMQEMVTRVKIQQHGCQFSPPFGGGGGIPFREVPDNCNAIIEGISIRSAALIDSIRIVYRLSNGRSYTGAHHGGGTGVLHTENINVDAGERIIAVSGKSGQYYVEQLQFFTNWGRILGPYGGCGGGNFKVNSCLVRGIFGKSAALLDSIGFVCSHP